jgi:DNA-binding transcriptional regulator YbjK
VAAGERRAQIADAALRLIGSVGARGLTHRAVDAEAGLPAGSTSYYCRRRAELLALALSRHAELDHRAMARLEGFLTAEGARGTLAGRLSAALATWMRGQDAAELAARYELFLAASREPELHAVLQESRKRFSATLSAALHAADVPRARARTLSSALIALIEGLLVDRLRTGSETLRPAQLEGLLDALLR